MENNNKKTDFDKKAYDKQYIKTHYTQYAAMIPNEQTNDIEKYRLLNDMSKADFVKAAIAYFLENH